MKIDGKMIREARMRQNLSLCQLANRMNPRISHGSLGLYERNRLTPPETVLDSITAALDIPLDELTGSGEKSSRLIMRWKKTSKVTEINRQQLESLVEEAVDKNRPEQQLHQTDASDHDFFSQFRDRKFSDFHPSAKSESLESLSAAIRKKLSCGMEPIASLEKHCYENSMVMIKIDSHEDIHDLFCYLPRSKQPLRNPIEIIPVSSRCDTNKVRFHLAQRFCHRLLDTGYGLIFGVGDGHSSIMPDFAKKQQEFEYYINYMASAFLIPRDKLSSTVKWMRIKQPSEALTAENIQNLSKYYGAPTKVVIERLVHTGIISRSEAKKLSKSAVFDAEHD